MSGEERGATLSLGPFKFKVPDRDCQVVGCDEKADGIVEYDSKGGTVSCCIYCAPDFLEVNASEWRPLAGGRELVTDTDCTSLVEGRDST